MNRFSFHLCSQLQVKKLYAVLVLRKAIQKRIIDKILGQIEMKSWILQSESKLTAIWVFLWLSLCLSLSVLHCISGAVRRKGFCVVCRPNGSWFSFVF